MVQAGGRRALNSPAEQPPKSGRAGVRYHADEWTDRGVVAQLGEHLHGMQGVGGSSPPSSTTSLREASVKLRWYREVNPFVLTTEGFVVSTTKGPMQRRAT